MDGIGIATLALRLAAVYVWIQALLQVFLLSALLSFRAQIDPAASLTGWLVSFFGQLALGAILWFASRALARRVLGTEERQPLRDAVEIGSLALRLAGIWLLDETFRRAPQLLSLARTAQAGAHGPGLPAEFAALGVLVLAALVLLIGGRRIAKWSFPKPTRAEPVTATLQPIAFGVLGLGILASALPSLATELVRSRWGSEEGSLFGLMSANTGWPVDTSLLIRVILGAALFLGSGPLTRFWRWAHTAGLERGPAT